MSSDLPPWIEALSDDEVQNEMLAHGITLFWKALLDGVEKLNPQEQEAASLACIHFVTDYLTFGCDCVPPIEKPTEAQKQKQQEWTRQWQQPRAPASDSEADLRARGWTVAVDPLGTVWEGLVPVMLARKPVAVTEEEKEAEMRECFSFFLLGSRDLEASKERRATRTGQIANEGIKFIANIGAELAKADACPEWAKRTKHC